MLELPDIFFKYLFLFETFSFGVIFTLIPLYRQINKQSKKINSAYLLSNLGFIDLKQGYTTKFPIVNSYVMCLMVFNTILSTICLTSLSFLWLPFIFLFISIIFISIHIRITFYEDYFLIRYLYKKSLRLYYNSFSSAKVQQGYKHSIAIHISFKDNSVQEKKISFHPAYWYRDRELISIILANKVNGRTETEVLNNLNENDF